MELLDQAVAAYRSALEVYTRERQAQDLAMTQNDLGDALEDSLADLRSALEVRTKAYTRGAWVQTQNLLGDALWTLGNQLKGEEGLKRQQESVEAFRELMAYQPSDQSRFVLAHHLGGLAFNLVLNRQFADAQADCEKAQRLANEIGDGVQRNNREDLIFIQGNLAHALLFQGHYDEALAIYRQYWDKPLNGKTFGELTLGDFAAFDKAGLTHPDLSRMKQALGDSRSKSPNP